MNRPLAVTRPPAREGVAWLKQGWAWYKASPIPWSGMTALVMLATGTLAILPWVGGFMLQALSPFIVAGYMSASQAAEDNQPVTYLHLGAGFRPENRVGLALMGAIYLVGILFISLVLRQMGGDSLQQLAQLAVDPTALQPEQAQAAVDAALPILLTGALLLTPLIMATWFAPALVLFDGFSAVNALWWSLWASAVNWRPLLSYSLLLGVAGIVAMLIPFGLGLLVFLPLALCTTYAAYRAIFQPVTPA